MGANVAALVNDFCNLLTEYKCPWFCGYVLINLISNYYCLSMSLVAIASALENCFETFYCCGYSFLVRIFNVEWFICDRFNKDFST